MASWRVCCSFLFFQKEGAIPATSAARRAKTPNWTTIHRSSLFSTNFYCFRFVNRLKHIPHASASWLLELNPHPQHVYISSHTWKMIQNSPRNYAFIHPHFPQLFKNKHYCKCLNWGLLSWLCLANSVIGCHRGALAASLNPLPQAQHNILYHQQLLWGITFPYTSYCMKKTHFLSISYTHTTLLFVMHYSLQPNLHLPYQPTFPLKGWRHSPIPDSNLLPLFLGLQSPRTPESCTFTLAICDQRHQDNWKGAAKKPMLQVSNSCSRK